MPEKKWNLQKIVVSTCFLLPLHLPPIPFFLQYIEDLAARRGKYGQKMQKRNNSGTFGQKTSLGKSVETKPTSSTKSIGNPELLEVWE